MVTVSTASESSGGVADGNTADVSGGVRREEYVRLLIQALGTLGYSDSAEKLTTESGIELQSSEVTQFREAVESGNWDKCVTLLPSLELTNGTSAYENVRFIIGRQKYLELLSVGNHKSAVSCLRNELAPLRSGSPELHLLSSLVMCRDRSEIQAKMPDWAGAGPEAREELLTELRQHIPASVFLPADRLTSLLRQSVEWQTNQCLYHNVNVDDDDPFGADDLSVSLFSDHQCDRTQLPLEMSCVLSKHSDEVWFVSFSHCGRYLASGSRDASAIIWDMNCFNDETGEREPAVLHRLTGHLQALSFLSWSPNDKFLLTCGNDNLVKLWNTETGRCVQTYSKHSDSVTSCAWFPDNERFATGSQDGNIFIFNINGTTDRVIEVPRINDLTVSSDGRRLVAVCQEKKIRVFDMESDHVFFIQERDPITSLCLSNDNRYLLVNISLQDIHCWDLETRRLVKKYRGRKQGRFVIRSAFGGSNQSFIVSGSEDSRVYMWHRQSETLLQVLNGHTSTVNTVAWNPRNNYMFVSGSDDHTIRVWEAKVALDKRAAERSHNSSTSTPSS